jgi:DNA repair protein RecO (recombination protein O)
MIPFRDRDDIFFIFTSHAGLIKVLYRRGYSKYQGKLGLCTPLTKVEVIYREKKGEIFSCVEMACLDSFSVLRQRLLFLEVACDLLQVILASQFVGKPAPQLYALLCFYLKKIPQMVNPWILAASFRLKLLRHDGLIALPFTCCECRQVLQNEAFIRESEGWCIKHKPHGSGHWELSELQTFYQLAICQSYQEICVSDVSLSLQNKIAHFFDSCVKK